MKPILVILFVGCLFFEELNGQVQVGVDKSKFADVARARYYNLEHQGLVSFTCDVKVDWETVPKQMLLPAEIAGRKRLEATRIKATLGPRSSPVVKHEYTPDTPALAKVAYDPFFVWLSDVVTGFLMTWEVKGIVGPIPGENNISTVTPTSSGYSVFLVGPSVKLLVTKNYQVAEAISSFGNETIDEHFVFTPSPDGLLFTRAEAVDKQGDNTTRIQYDVDYSPVDSLRLPHNVHLVVNDNINMKFSFENCSVIRGDVVEVSAHKAK
jgi:hypothetical protein